MHRMTQLLLPILRGEETGSWGEGRLRRLARTEEGLMTWATLIAVVCFCTLIAAVFNVGRIANDKLEAQNAADSAAYSASLVQARAMNAITASNHMMGELTALYTMHHAIGGKVLDDGKRKNNAVVIGLNIGLFGIHKGALLAYGVGLINPALVPFTGVPNYPEGYGPADDVPKGEATIYDSKCLLKLKLIEQYVNHIQGSIDIIKGQTMTLSIWPPTVAAGFGKIGDGHNKRSRANSEIRALVREYRFINRLESFAISTKSIKKNVLPALLDGLWAYERLIAGDLIPRVGAEWKADAAAAMSAKKNMCFGEALGRPSAKNIGLSQLGFPSATLPIVQDPTESKDRTQLMRATYPWVQEWRWPLLAGFDLAAHRSRAARFYEYHSDRYSRETCDKFRKDRGYKLYVLEELDATKGRGRDKGSESWRTRNGSSTADQLFCLVGLARHEKPPAMSHIAFLPVTNPEPIAAMSQAMIYNANRPQKWKRQSLDFISLLLRRRAQPVSGWDTLNYTEGATEWKEGKGYFGWLPLDFHWILGRLTFFDIVQPPDIKFPPVPGIKGIGPPEPKIQLNWQSKLVPIAPRNLGKRVLMTRDKKLKQRMVKQVLPAILAQELGSEVIHH